MPKKEAGLYDNLPTEQGCGLENMPRVSGKAGEGIFTKPSSTGVVKGKGGR